MTRNFGHILRPEEAENFGICRIQVGQGTDTLDLIPADDVHSNLDFRIQRLGFKEQDFLNR